MNWNKKIKKKGGRLCGIRLSSRNSYYSEKNTVKLSI